MTDLDKESNEIFAQIEAHIAMCKTVVETLSDDDKTKVYQKLAELEQVIDDMKK